MLKCRNPPEAAAAIDASAPAATAAAPTVLLPLLLSAASRAEGPAAAAQLSWLCFAGRCRLEGPTSSYTSNHQAALLLLLLLLLLGPARLVPAPTLPALLRRPGPNVLLPLVVPLLLLLVVEGSCAAAASCTKVHSSLVLRHMALLVRGRLGRRRLCIAATTSTAVALLCAGPYTTSSRCRSCSRHGIAWVCFNSKA
jgi:hypothetical protein